MADLFLKLLNASISASYLVVAVVLLRLALKKAPKWVFPMLWGMVALRLLFPISIESVLSLQPSAQPIPPDIAMAPHPAINSGIPMVNQAVNPVIAEAFTPSPTASANPLQIWLWVGGWGWLAGMTVMLLYTLITYLRLRRRVSTAVPLWGNLYQCETVASPFVLGLIFPRIYLPFGLEGKEQSYIVAHEQAHIRRKDHLWKPLGFALLAVHWFNPLMWLAYILLCRDIELACDEKVIQQLGREGRADYSQALLRCSISRRSIAACPLAFGEVGVKQRVKSVLSYKKPAFWIIVTAVISGAVLAVCFLTNPKEEKQPEVQPGEYHSQEILYSTIGIILDNKIVQDLFDCQIREDHQLLIQPCSDEDGAEENWHIIGRLAKCQLTNEMLSDLIYLPNNWLADVQDDNGSLDIGAITDAWSATLGRYGETALDLTVPGATRDAFLVFSTDTDETYLAQCSVLGDGGEYPYINYITYLARLGPRPWEDTRPALDAADWGIGLQVEQASPTGATVVFNQLTDSAGYEYVGGNDYLLQRKADGTWEDVPRLQDPTFAKDGYTISTVRRHEIDWSWLYGALPGGNYRIGKALTRRSFVYPEEQVPEKRAMAYGEFTIGSPEDVILSIQSVSSTGISVGYWSDSGPIVEGMMAGEDYRLEAWSGGRWVNLPTLREPDFGEKADSITGGSIPQQTFDWSQTYGNIPDGRYRLCKKVWIDGAGKEAEICGEFALHLSGRPLDLEELMALADSGRDLGWEDFSNFAYAETWDSDGPESHRYSRIYEMDGPLHFVMTGYDSQKKPCNMVLSCQEDGEFAIIRPLSHYSPDMVQFLLDVHNNPGSQGSHWGVSLVVENPAPTGADIRYVGQAPADSEFVAVDRYYLYRQNEAGAWVPVPAIRAADDTPDVFRDHHVDWEDRFGALPEGVYRMWQLASVNYLWSEEQGSYIAGSGVELTAQFTIGQPLQPGLYASGASLVTDSLTPTAEQLSAGPFQCRLSQDHHLAFKLAGEELWGFSKALEPYTVPEEDLILLAEQLKDWTGRDVGGIRELWSARANIWFSGTSTGDRVYLLRTGDGGVYLGVGYQMFVGVGRGWQCFVSELTRTEKYAPEPASPDGSVALDVYALSDSSLSLRFRQSSGDYGGLWTTENYVLQRRENGDWINLTGEKDGGTPIPVTGSGVIQKLDGLSLPTGQYRVGKDLIRNGEKERLWAEFALQKPGGGVRMLTTQDVLDLLEQEGNISWEDLEKFAYAQIESRLDFPWVYREYEIDPRLYLVISGPALDTRPDQLLLRGRSDDPMDWVSLRKSPYFDDTRQNVEDFIRRHESLATDSVRPLSELPANYNPEDAAIDGCLVTRAGELWAGEEQFRAFAEAAGRKEKAFLRIMNDVPGSLTERRAAVYDLHFDGSRYELRWLEDGREKSTFFRCLNHYEGQREASANVLEAYEYYALTDDPNASLARIEIPGVYPQDHFTVYGVHAIQPKRPALPEKPASADLKIGGEILLTVTDPAKLEQLRSLFAQTEVLGYKPGNHSLDPGLELIVWGDDGARTAIGLDRDGEICCIDGKFSCYYSGDGTSYLPRLWDCLGIEGWPDETGLPKE